VPRAIRIRPPGAPYEVRVVGARATPLRDLYHLLLRRSWGFTCLVIAGVFLTTNALFATGYLVLGGVANARHGSFADSFFFSVQTLATIGYGALYPKGTAAHVLVVAESISGIILTALVTGLVFAKFSRSTARIVFAHDAVIGPMNGRPTLSFRVGNERGNQIVDARIRVVLTRNERVDEGDKTSTFYRMLDLKLVREHALSLSRSWSVQHPIDEASPLHGATPASFAEQESELLIMVIGLDDTSMQPVHAAHRYFAHQIRWGARYADILSEAEDGALVLDLGRFHAVEPTAPTAGFPYSLSQ
jgi:inward rectifier potassium channel